jgi:hypothetical protein
VATTKSKRKGAKPKSAVKSSPKATKAAKAATAAGKEAAKLAATAALAIKVRRSKVHGQGVFALKRIRKGTRIIEYVGDRISHARANRRYDDHDENDNHTFLFAVDRNVVIDATVDGNDSRFINHSCDPNCESNIEKRRVFIDAIRTIEVGDELNYDYQIGRERDDPPDVDVIYACRCGAKDCRGTMLWPPKRPALRKKKSAATKRSGARRAS